MNLIKNIILLSLSALFFASGCSTTNDIRVEEGITAEQRKIAIALAVFLQKALFGLPWL